MDFLAAVWRVNSGLAPSKRLRAVLVDQSWDWSRVKTAQDLRVLGDRLFTVVQHGPVMGNRGGQLDGRVRRGLFDEAFARAGNTPVAFALARSPFGAEPFDMAIDLRGFEGTLGRTLRRVRLPGPARAGSLLGRGPGLLDAWRR